MMEYSVLMTVYKNDNKQYLEDALLSMVNQTRRPNEIVLVNDGPIPSELQAVIDNISISNKNLINQVSLEKNVGLGLALNAGLKVAKNEIVARMDSDDISMPTRCERQIELFERNPKLDIVGCPVLEFVGTPENIVGERNVPVTNDEIYKFARKRDPFNHPSVMYRKSKVLKVGGYSDLRKNQDTDLWIKMLSDKAQCMNTEDPLLWFRFDEGTYKKRKNWLNTKLLIGIRWKAYKSGFNSFFDFLQVAIVQLSIYILPIGFQKFIYTKILRK